MGTTRKKEETNRRADSQAQIDGQKLPRNPGIKKHTAESEVEYFYAQNIPGISLLRRFWQYVRESNTENRCWEWIEDKDSPTYDPNEYPTLKVNGKSYKTHRLAYYLFCGSINDPSEYVLHRCDNPKCVRPGHLYLGDQVQNMRDAKVRGRLNKKFQFKAGEEAEGAKLTWPQVREIRKRWRERTMNQEQLAQVFGVDRSTVSHIVRNKTWLNDPLDKKKG